MAYLRDRRAFGNIGTRKFRGARFGDALSPRFRGLLDQYGGAAAAYSLRALSSGWAAGDVVRARRVNTPGEANFTAGQVANGELATWALSGDAFVTTWYDQSGNANDAVQATTTTQPKIVSAGALVTGGLDFDGVDDQLGLTGTGLDIFKNVGYGQVFSVATSDEVSTSGGRILEMKTSGTGGRYVLGESTTTSASYRIGGRRLDADTFDSTSASVGHGSTEKLITGFANWSDAEAYIYQNGANVGTDLSFQTAGLTSNTSSKLADTGIGSIGFNGRIREVIIYNTDQSANRVAIEANINAAYTIY